MKSLTKKVKNDLNPNLIEIGTCNIHKVHNAFHHALENFGSNVESLGIELFYYFKSSAVMREDYEKAQSHEGIKKHIFIRHVPSRWLTLNDVIERLDEQLPALKYYFLKSKFVSESN